MLDEVVQQRADVLSPFAQRRHVQVHDADPEKQVFAKESLQRQPRQVAVRRSDDPGAHRDAGMILIFTNPLHFAGVEESEQQPLHPWRHLADFVQENRSAVRLPQFTGFVAIRAGEAALHVAKELRLEQRIGNAGAVERNERPFGIR